MLKKLLICLSVCAIARLESKTALISTSNKTDIVALAQSLLKNDYDKIISTGGTYKTLYEGFSQSERACLYKVSEVTNFPEILDGRVKTLLPAIHGGILARHDDEVHRSELQHHHINPIHMLVVNLYPFQEVIAKRGTNERQAIENIDIGGVALVRAAAKNYQYVTVVTDPADYPMIMENPELDLNTRRELALKAFKHTAQYDAAIARFLSNGDFIMRSYQKIKPLRYGLNPHQQDAAYYAINNHQNPYHIINGAPGYINMLDINRAWGLVWEAGAAFNMPCAASFKHTSPAGAALDDDLSHAVKKALDADPVSSFGNIIAVSHKVDEPTAEIVRKWVCDGIVAPGFSEKAIEILKKKKRGKFFILSVDTNVFDATQTQFRELDGNIALSQQPHGPVDTAWEYKTNHEISEHAKQDLKFANIVVKYCESNSVAIVKDLCAIGMGTGQQNRLQCIEIAVEKAANWYLRQHPRVRNIAFQKGVTRTLKHNAIAEFLKGDAQSCHFIEPPSPITYEEREQFLQDADFALASDAFMPFVDNVEAAKYVKYIIQPGGSIRDKEVIEACQQKGIGLVFTGMRLFNH